MKKHEMVYERGGMRKPKKKAVKKSRKASPINRQLRTLKRTAWNVLGGVGFVTVVLVLFQLARGAW